jgi:hypothetical protein
MREKASVAYFKVLAGETEEDRDHCKIADFKVTVQYPKWEYWVTPL